MSRTGDNLFTENARRVHYELVDIVTPPTPLKDYSAELITSDDKEAQIIEKPIYQNFRTRRKRCCCYSLRKFIAYCLILILITVPVALLGMKSLGPCSYNTILSFNRNEIVPFLRTRNNITVSEYRNETIFQVTLFGDSLIDRPFLNLDLDGKIKSYLPQFTLEISNVASSGVKISDMRNRLDEVLDPEVKPDAIILYWDSDVSDVDESKMSPDEVDELREKYKEDLSYLLSQLVPNITFVAVAGPGILGEGPMFMPKSDRFNKDKNDMLNSYREMNRELAEDYQIPYIDMRQAFLDAIPSYRLNYKHCVTYDGEHENEYGTLIVAELMSKTIFEWIKDDDINEF